MATPLEVVAKSVETLVSNCGALATALRATVPAVASLHEAAPSEPEALTTFRRQALAAYGRAVPLLKAVRSAIDEHLSAIEGTWKPPTH